METALQKFKKIKNFVIHNLESEVTGYGPYGHYTRKMWRAICIQKFNSGRASFNAWQIELKKSTPISYEKADYGYTVNCDDGSSYASPVSAGSRCTLDFTGHEFDVRVNAYEYTFLMPVTFNAATFLNDSIFDLAVFSLEAWFETVLFTGKAKFNKTKFNGSAVCFNNSRFLDTATFVQAEFKCLTLFKEAVFDKRINFESASFATVGHFEGANFLTRIPNFSGTSKSSTEIVFDEKPYFSKKVAFTEDIAYLGILKRLADEHGQTDQALNFNALELMAKAKQPNVDISLKAITFLYRVFSDFGRSFVRPFVTYLCLFIFTFIIGLWNAAQNVPPYSKCDNDFFQIMNTSINLKCLDYSIKKDDNEVNGLRAAFEYAAYRGSGIIDFVDNDKQTALVAQRVFGQSYEPGWARGWGIFKAIASTALLFLAALGLRNKYRIK